MSYTPTEARYFYWHCTTVAVLLEHLKRNTATNVHLNNAVRMATLNAVGRRGISLASPLAAECIAKSTGPTRFKGLIREHVVPVSVISQRVVAAWQSDKQTSWRELVPCMTNEDCLHWGIIDSDKFLDAGASLSAVVAATVRASSLLAWVTPADNAKLRSRGLAKCMPEGDESPHARYTACGISLADFEIRT